MKIEQKKQYKGLQLLAQREEWYLARPPHKASQAL